MTKPGSGGLAAHLHTLLERMRHATFTQGARVIALTAPHANAGNSLIAALFVGVIEAFGSFWASAFKEVIVFTLILPVLLIRSLRSGHSDEDH